MNMFQYSMYRAFLNSRYTAEEVLVCFFVGDAFFLAIRVSIQKGVIGWKKSGLQTGI